MKRAIYWGACSAWVVTGVLSMAVLARPQSLGEVARRDQERRELAAKKPKKVYTNDDFPSVAPAVVPAPTGPSPTAQSKEPPTPSTKVDEAELESQWRRRFAETRARLHKAEQDAWQTRIKTVFVSSGGFMDQISGSLIPMQMQVREFVETDEWRLARKAMDDLEEELRHAGLPPGWGR